MFLPYEVFIGLRYLKAKRKQTFISIITFISIAGVMVGVMALIVVLAVMTGFQEDLRDKILGTNSHIVVTQYGEGMHDFNDVAEKVEKVQGIVAATPFIYSQIMLTSENNVSGVVVRGIDPEREADVTKVGENMEEGSLTDLISKEDATDEKDKIPGIIIGKELSRILGVFLGEEINMVSPLGNMTPMGMVPRMKKYRIVGIFDSGMYEYDTSLAYISIESAQTFFNMKDTVTGIEVKVTDFFNAHHIAKEVRKVLGHRYLVRDWMQMNRNIFTALEMEKAVMFIILLLIILVASFNIVSTLIMVVMEKGKDIAILKSMGATSSSIMKIFLIEGMVIGVVGTLLGGAAGVILSLNLENLLIAFEKSTGIKILSPEVYYLDKIPVHVNYIDVFMIMASAIAITLFATIYPAWQASRLDPAEALRYE
ncbi:MAG: lipoprotein-releasing ABC transporter permease subunit [Deltaproteobacteria bacterium]|nr:lipoprotein-releasing ABC transporter permease subunit [Deltaproteobacteria bacterium]